MENEIGTDKTINLLKDINAEIEGAGYEADLSEAAKMKKEKSMEFHKPLLFLLHLYRHLHHHIILILIIHQTKQKSLKLILNRKIRIHQFQVVLLQFLSPFLLQLQLQLLLQLRQQHLLFQNPMHLLHSKVDTLKRTKRTKNLCLMVILNLQVHHHITNYHKDLNLVVGQQLHLHLHQFLLQLYQTHVHHHHQYQ